MNRVLLLLNGPDGSQTGIEDGFNFLFTKGLIESVECCYFQNVFLNEGVSEAIMRIMKLAINIQPSVIVFFHTTSFPFDKMFVNKLRALDSRPVLVYDEGDMYGGLSKQLSSRVVDLMKIVDFVSVRGLGKFRQKIETFNTNIIYTPHSNSLYRFTEKLETSKVRNRLFLFIGNRVRSKFGNLRRLPGAYGREKFVAFITAKFPNKVIVHGINWNLSQETKQLPFVEQVSECAKYWFHISYEHYPHIPYYFSDRLPISLACGQIYICHYHEGYDKIFAGLDFIYFYKTSQECVDIMTYLLSLSEDELWKKSINARNWADKNLSPIVVWSNFYHRILEAN